MAPGNGKGNGRSVLLQWESSVSSSLRAPEPPLLEETADSTHFLDNTSKYNSVFEVTSMGCNEIKQSTDWTPTSKVHGQVCHLIGSMCPMPNEVEKFAQIYCIGDEETEYKGQFLV